jgi:hypothetical protein
MLQKPTQKLPMNSRIVIGDGILPEPDGGVLVFDDNESL